MLGVRRLLPLSSTSEGLREAGRIKTRLIKKLLNAFKRRS